MKKLIVIILLLLVAGGVAFYFLQSREFSVTLSEEEIQERLEEVFPIEQRHMMVLTVRLTDPRVTLVEGEERIHCEVGATASLPGVSRGMEGRGRISGSLRYESGERQLFLSDARVEELEVEGVPNEYDARVREVASIAVRQHLERRPFYTIDQELLDQLPGPVALRDVKVQDGRLRLSFGLGTGGKS